MILAGLCWYPHTVVCLVIENIYCLTKKTHLFQKCFHFPTIAQFPLVWCTVCVLIMVVIIIVELEGSLLNSETAAWFRNSQHKLFFSKAFNLISRTPSWLSVITEAYFIFLLAVFCLLLEASYTYSSVPLYKCICTFNSKAIYNYLKTLVSSFQNVVSNIFLVPESRHHKGLVCNISLLLSIFPNVPNISSLG